MLVALAGGVGAARFLRGLVRIIAPEELVAIINTGDDIEMFGLHVSPDLDIVMYTLAGIVDEEKGWGIKGDTFRCLEMLGRYGLETWFKLGDADLATHIYRTALLREGRTLAEATRVLCEALGVKSRLLPATNDPFHTEIVTRSGAMHFEEYYVKLRWEEEPLGVRFVGAESAKPAPGVIESIEEAEAVIICPSNPVVSVGAILAVKGVREALGATSAPVVAISPIIGGRPVKGPADKLMRCIGAEVSAYGVAELYADFLDGIVIDRVDAHLKPRIEALGVEVRVTDTLMQTLDDSIALARFTLNFIHELDRRKGQ